MVDFVDSQKGVPATPAKPIGEIAPVPTELIQDPVNENVADPSKTDLALTAFTDAANKVGYATLWKHYKGGIYEVRGFAIDTQAEGTVAGVLYARKAGDDYDHAREGFIQFFRPLDEFTGEASPGVARFEKLS